VVTLLLTWSGKRPTSSRLSSSSSCAPAVIWACVSGLDGAPLSANSRPYQWGFPSAQCHAFHPLTGPIWTTEPSCAMQKWALACDRASLNHETEPGLLPTWVWTRAPVTPDGTLIPPLVPLRQGHGELCVMLIGPVTRPSGPTV